MLRRALEVMATRVPVFASRSGNLSPRDADGRVESTGRIRGEDPLRRHHDGDDDVQCLRKCALPWMRGPFKASGIRVCPRVMVRVPETGRINQKDGGASRGPPVAAPPSPGWPAPSGRGRRRCSS